MGGSLSFAGLCHRVRLYMYKPMKIARATRIIHFPPPGLGQGKGKVARLLWVFICQFMFTNVHF